MKLGEVEPSTPQVKPCRARLGTGQMTRHEYRQLSRRWKLRAPSWQSVNEIARFAENRLFIPMIWKMRGPAAAQAINETTLAKSSQKIDLLTS